MNLRTLVSRVLDKIRNRVYPILNAVKRVIKVPKLPKNKDGKVLIHLGCGPIDDSRWINVDLLYLPHIHYIQDITKLNNFPDDTADLIYACHVFEHISHRSLRDVLTEWRRVLKPGGILRLSVPDFDDIIKIYNSESGEIGSVVKPLMGGQDYAYNFHYSIFNKTYLSDLLKNAGFKEIQEWNPETAPYHNFNDWSSKLYPINGHEYRISLNLEAVK